MKELIRGVHRFRTHVFPTKQRLFAELAKGQRPTALMISCADSRVDMQLVTQSEPGQLFGFRNVGNLVPPYGAALGAASASIEYAMTVLEIPNIVVCGHSDCGAMKGLLSEGLSERVPTVAKWLRFADLPRQMVLSNPDISDEHRLDRLIHENVIAQLEHLKTHPSVAVRLARGEVQLHGWVYDIADGHVSGWDAASERFVPIDSQPTPHATPVPRLWQREVEA
jgi:carbonic anhydrase